MRTCLLDLTLRQVPLERDRFLHSDHVATPPNPAVEKEPQYIWIEIKLSGQDLKNVKRILEGKFEVSEDGWIVVKVKV